MAAKDHFNKAYTLYEQDKHVKAIAEFTNAIELGLKYHNTLSLLVQIEKHLELLGSK